MKRKVGDKVKVKSLEWYDESEKDEDGDIVTPNDAFFISDMKEYCGKDATITHADDELLFYYIDLDNGDYCWEDAMFED